MSSGLSTRLTSCSTTPAAPSAFLAWDLPAADDRLGDAFRDRERERPDEEDDFDADITCLLHVSCRQASLADQML